MLDAGAPPLARLPKVLADITGFELSCLLQMHCGIRRLGAPQSTLAPFHDHCLRTLVEKYLVAIRRTTRFHHVDRIARLVPLTGVVRWKFDCGLRDSVFGNDKGKLIIAIAFAVETKRPFCCRARDFCPDLCCTLPLTFLDNNRP
jgi:hypothetical protein